MLWIDAGIIRASMKKRFTLTLEMNVLKVCGYGKVSNFWNSTVLAYSQVTRYVYKH